MFLFFTSKNDSIFWYANAFCENKALFEQTAQMYSMYDDRRYDYEDKLYELCRVDDVSVLRTETGGNKKIQFSFSDRAYYPSIESAFRMIEYNNKQDFYSNGCFCIEIDEGWFFVTNESEYIFIPVIMLCIIIFEIAVLVICPMVMYLKKRKQRK